MSQIMPLKGRSPANQASSTTSGAQDAAGGTLPERL